MLLSHQNGVFQGVFRTNRKPCLETNLSAHLKNYAILLKFAIVFSLCSVATCTLLGGYVSVDPSRPDVILAANYAKDRLNENSTSPYLLRIKLIQSAEKQVVNGYNYRLTFVVGLTDCKKKETPVKNIPTCKFQLDDNKFFSCNVTIYQTLDVKFTLHYSHCSPSLNETLNLTFN